MRVCDITFIDGCTGEIIMDITSPKNLTREIVKTEINPNGTIYYTILEEDRIKYLAWEYQNIYGKVAFKDFLSECSCCGGDWVGMLFTGMKRKYPKVWDAIPNDKVFSFVEICQILEKCGVIVE